MEATESTATDFTLDERQRGMLEAMGIKLWLPDQLTAPEQSSSRESAKPVLAEKFEQKAPVTSADTARDAIEK
ncbi:MAG: hypothetical protein HC765_01450 [Brachymonas sp.]|nr:hypothetical protein [Brachymonas sp.]